MKLKSLNKIETINKEELVFVSEAVKCFIIPVKRIVK